MPSGATPCRAARSERRPRCDPATATNASVPERARDRGGARLVGRPGLAAARRAGTATPDANTVARGAELHLSAHRGRRAIARGAGDARAVLCRAVALQLAAR